nr:hypothetical protein [uncultured Campylobacter sp.]
MKVITIAIVNGKVVNEKELIAGIINYDDFTAVAEQLRKALKSSYFTANEHARIYKKISAETGFRRVRFDYKPYKDKISNLIAQGYTVKAILKKIGEEDEAFKNAVTAPGLTHFISVTFKDEKTRLRAIAQKSEDFLYAYRFEIKKMHFQGVSNKEILKYMKAHYEKDFAKVSERDLAAFIEANAVLDTDRKLSLYKKPSLYDPHFSEIMKLYASGMRVYDIWKTLKAKYPELAKLQAPSLYQFIANNALGKAKYMQKD